MAPPRNTGDVLNNPRKDYSMDLKSVATWTDVAHHRAGFYSVQQQQGVGVPDAVAVLVKPVHQVVSPNGVRGVPLHGHHV